MVFVFFAIFICLLLLWRYSQAMVWLVIAGLVAFGAVVRLYNFGDKQYADAKDCKEMFENEISSHVKEKMGRTRWWLREDFDENFRSLIRNNRLEL